LKLKKKHLDLKDLGLEVARFEIGRITFWPDAKRPQKDTGLLAALQSGKMVDNQ
jgi:hypothetical protein